VLIGENSELSKKNAANDVEIQTVRQNSDTLLSPKPRAGGVPLESLSRHLVSLAREAAQDVLTGYTSDERRESVQRIVDAGMVVEHLVKAVLAGLSPSLLADRTDPRSILTFAGVALTPVPAASELKTITFRESLRLVVIAEPRSKPIELYAGSIISARNAAAHMGMVDPAVRNSFAQELVRIVSILLPILNTEPESFWSKRLMPVVEALERINDDRSLARVVSKITKAREIFAEITRGLSSDLSEATLRALESRETFLLMLGCETQRSVCPACTRSGWVLYERRPHWESAEFEYDGYLGAPSDCFVPVDLEPIDFSCPVCSLFLEGSEGELDTVDGIETIEQHVWESVSINDYRLIPPD
jgi:hypothetical protein